MKMVMSSALGLVRKSSVKRDVVAPARSLTASIGTRPRYSTWRITSAAVGAAIEPPTTSPACVSAR